MRLEINGRSVSVPCTKKALSFTDNLTDDALLNMDTIDKQMIQEQANIATLEPCKMLTRMKKPPKADDAELMKEYHVQMERLNEQRSEYDDALGIDQFGDS